MLKNYALCLEVLRRIQKAGILNEIMVIGSWCIYFYRDYFSDVDYSSSIRTRDIDFLIPIPKEVSKNVIYHARLLLFLVLAKLLKR